MSDEALGPELALLGLGVDPRQCLSERSLGRWSRAGGRMVHVSPRGRRPPVSHTSIYEDLDGHLVPGAAPYGWCLAVRPDRTVLHDGPVQDADRIVHESLDILGTSVD